MKIRTDFVTNSSSSSFVAIHLKSKAVAAVFEENKGEIEAANDGYCDINIAVEGDWVSVETGDRDAFLLDVPDGTDSAVSMLISLCGIDGIDRASKTKLADSIEELEWSAEQWGLDGDDGRFDKSNYDSDVLSELFEEIALSNDCRVENVTDKMFIDYVTPEDDTITAEASFKYNKSTGECRYYYFNGMHRVIIDRQQKAALTCDWIKDRIFVLTGFDEKTEKKYERIIEQSGGIVKSSTVLKTDYLIYNSDYDHETTKLKRAKELIEKGKPIQLLTTNEFCKKLTISDD